MVNVKLKQIQFNHFSMNQVKQGNDDVIKNFFFFFFFLQYIIAIASHAKMVVNVNAMEFHTPVNADNHSQERTVWKVSIYTAILVSFI